MMAYILQINDRLSFEGGYLSKSMAVLHICIVNPVVVIVLKVRSVKQAFAILRDDNFVRDAIVKDANVWNNLHVLFFKLPDNILFHPKVIISFNFQTLLFADLSVVYIL